MIEVIPAILEKDFSEIERKIHQVEGLVSWVQIDIADGKLVSNTVLLNPADFARLKTPLNLELHMMVEDPVSFLKPFSSVGFRRFFAHVESGEAEEFIEAANMMDVEIGLAIDGPTDFEVIHPYLDNLDAVLVMAIEAGFSGRPYREDTAEKIQKIRETDFKIPIAVDGAMSADHAAKVVAAGATRINSNSYIFGTDNIRDAIATLRNL